MTTGTFYPSGNMLDLVFTSDPDRLSFLEVLEPLPGCSHCPVLSQYVFQFESPVVSPISSRSFFRGNYNRMNALLQSVDWWYEFQGLDVDGMYARFLLLVGEIVAVCVPMASQRTKCLPWESRPPRSLTVRRCELWQEYKSVRSVHGRSSSVAVALLDEYNSVNHEYRNFSFNKQCQYEWDLILHKSDRPKLFHSYIRGKKVGKPRVGPLKLPSGQIITDSRIMAGSLAESFSSVYSVGLVANAAPHQTSSGSISSINITPDIVCKVLSSLDASSSMGPDELSPVVLKECCGSLAFPLAMLFRESLSSSVLPALWKQSLVVPIYKRGPRSDPLNYRPISLTSVACKVMERIIHKGLSDYLEENAILSNDQFGFRAGRSTEDQLLLVYDRVTKWVDGGYTVDVVLFDFAKAFDVVDHRLLLEKLSLVGVGGCLLGWIGQFLVGRMMRVVVDRSGSAWHSVLSGVPQGSVLGPLLFVIFINYLTHGISSSCKVFADDLKLYFPLRNPSNAISTAQNDIDIIYETALSWGLKLNVSKCSVLRCGPSNPDQLQRFYRIGGNVLPFVSFSPDLGITVDLSLKFHMHISQVVGKAAGLAANILRSTCNRQPEFMRELFITHVRPILDYSSCVWNTGYILDLKKLESVQRSWTRNVAGLEDSPYSERLRSLELYSIKGRLIRADILKVWKIFHGKSSILPDEIFSLSPLLNTRGHGFKLSHERCRLAVRQKFFAVRVVQRWNSLPESLVSLDCIDSFKRGLHSFLGDLLYSYED